MKHTTAVAVVAALALSLLLLVAGATRYPESGEGRGRTELFDAVAAVLVYGVPR